MKHHFTHSLTEAAHYSVNMHSVNLFLSLQLLTKPVRFQTAWWWQKVTRVCLFKRSVQGSSHVPVVSRVDCSQYCDWLRLATGAIRKCVAAKPSKDLTNNLFFFFLRPELNWTRERPNLFRPIKSYKWHIRSLMEVLLWERNDRESTLLKKFCDSSIQ